MPSLREIQGIRAQIRDIPDFPKPGILFRDITPLLLDADAFRTVINAFVERYAGQDLSKIVAVESRGFMFAGTIAYELGAGFVPFRKVGKLPYETISETYALEYGEAEIEAHRDAIEDGERVLIFDDLLATGGTAAASVALARRLGATVVETAFVVELSGLGGRDKLAGTPVFSLIQYD